MRRFSLAWMLGLLLVLTTGAGAQYTPLYTVDTIAAVGSYDAKGAAMDLDDGTIYLVDPVQDRVYATDASGTPLGDFSTEALGSFDGDGLAIDSGANELYLSDPVCDQVLVCTTGGTLLRSFGTEVLGAFDVHGAAFNGAGGELYLLDPVCDVIFAVEPVAGTLLRTIPTEPFGCFDGQGLAYDPARDVLLVADPVAGVVFEVSAADGTPVRAGDTEVHGLFDVKGAAFLPPSTLVLADPVCDVAAGLTVPVDFGDHNVGNIVLTMTDQGILGFLDDTQTAGSGLIYPAGSANRLFIGSLWLGADPTYVVNRDYSADPDQEWEVESDPDGHVRSALPGPNADQELYAGFDDGGAATPLGLSVRQESWSFSTAADGDFVIVRCFIHNRGPAPVNDLRAGIFLDVDIDPFGSNTGSTEPARRLAYMTDASNLHVGAALLEDPDAPDPLSNLSLVHNPTFVYPQQYMLDADKFGFLSAADPAHSVPDAPAPDDYSLLVAVGPFTLAPQDSNEVAFVIAGGLDLTDLEAHVDRAQQIYAPTVGVAEAGAVAPLLTSIIGVAPNPFNPVTRIRYELARPGQVRLAVHDPLGRTVRTLVDGWRLAGGHEIAWDGRANGGRAVASGVYFLRLDAGARATTRRVVLLK